MFRTTFLISCSILCLCGDGSVAEAQVVGNVEVSDEGRGEVRPSINSDIWQSGGRGCRKRQSAKGASVPLPPVGLSPGDSKLPADNPGFVLLKGASLPKSARNGATCLVLANGNAILRDGTVDEESPIWSLLRESMKDEELAPVHVRIYFDRVQEVPHRSLAKSIKKQLAESNVFVVMIDEEFSNVSEPWRNRVNRRESDSAAAGSDHSIAGLPPTTDGAESKWNPFFGPRQYLKPMPGGRHLARDAENVWQLMEDRSIAIRYRQGATRIFGFNKETGVWYEQRLPAELTIEPEVSNDMAFANVGAKVYAFGPAGFAWAELDTKSKNVPIIVFGNHSLVVTVDNNQWIYTSAFGKWSAAPPLPDVADPKQLPGETENAWQLVENRSIAIRYRKGATRIFGFNKETGAWYEQQLPAGLKIEPEVSDKIAFARVGAKVFAFQSGFDWAELDTMSKTTPIVVFGNGSLVVTADNSQWIYTSRSGKWSAAPPLSDAVDPK